MSGMPVRCQNSCGSEAGRSSPKPSQTISSYLVDTTDGLLETASRDFSQRLSSRWTLVTITIAIYTLVYG